MINGQVRGSGEGRDLLNGLEKALAVMVKTIGLHEVLKTPKRLKLVNEKR